MGWYHAMIAEGKDAFGDEAKACGCDAQIDETSGVLYHMAQKSVWEEAKREEKPYYAPSFKESGNINRASVDANALLKIANIAYKTVPGEWVCIVIDREALVENGIDTKIEPCDEKGGMGESCRQIHGGIPTNNDKIVTQVYSMSRLTEDGTFISINGLTTKSEKTLESSISKRDLLKQFL